MIFVCGTDTGVGKTHAAAALLWRYRTLSGIRYWKPVQTGASAEDPADKETVRCLTGLADSFFLPTYLSFTQPLSPHRAAELDGTQIDLDALIQKTRSISGPVIMEGAGGLCVPLTRSATWIDLLKACRIPVVLVARTGLGTINHSLLTLDRLKLEKIECAGIVFCGPENADNVRTVSEMSGARVLGSFEFKSREDFETVDPEGVLTSYL
ncbi:MAG TPA: dethiobiotin synthase [Leptospiraceae bacterium]|nr:dethiobiotin synthase [Leptospiraceae bacterium]HQI19673.1 dethiobiotin synthase [Leptospiraceae bacterium]